MLFIRTFLLVAILVIGDACEEYTYNGPAEANYFAICFNSTTSEIMPLECGNEYFMNISNQSEPVHYYQVDLTNEMVDWYIASLGITTCCPPWWLSTCTAATERYNYYSNFTNVTDTITYALDYYQDYIDHYCHFGSYCNQNTSLDTYLYILSEKKGQINLLDTVDDVSDTYCSQSVKSYIDLSSYAKGTYIIAVGGYAKEYGSYYINFDCQQYSYPIDEAEFDPPNNATMLNCNETLHNQTNKDTSAITYYQISATEIDLHESVTITTCPVNSDDYVQYDTHLYLIESEDKSDGSYTIITDNDDVGYCNPDLSNGTWRRFSEIIIDSSLGNYDTYELAVQGWDNDLGNFTITMTCSAGPTVTPTVEPTMEPSTPSPTKAPVKIQRYMMMAIVFGSCGALMIMIGIVYGYEWFNYYHGRKDDHHGEHLSINNNESNSDNEEHTNTHIASNVTNDNGNQIETVELAPLVDDDDGNNVGEQLVDALHTKRSRDDEMEMSDLDESMYEQILGQINTSKHEIVITAPEAGQPVPTAITITPVLSNEQKQETVEVIESVHSLLYTTVDDTNNIGQSSSEPTVNLSSSRHLGIINKKLKKKVTIRQINSRKTIEEQLEDGEDKIELILAHCIQSVEDGDIDIYQVLALRYYDPDSIKVRELKPLKRIGIQTSVITFSPYFLTLVTCVIVALLQTMGLTVVIYKLLSAHFAETAGIRISKEQCDMSAERWEEVYSLKMLAFLWSMAVTLTIGIVLGNVTNQGLNKIMEELSFDEMLKIPGVSLWALMVGQAINYYACFWAVIGSYFIILEENEDNEGNYASAGLDMIMNAVALFFMLELDDYVVSRQDIKDCQAYLTILLNEYEVSKHEQKMSLHDSCPGDCDLADELIFKMRDHIGRVTKIAYYCVNVAAIFVQLVCYGVGFFAPFFVFFCW